MFKKKGFRDVTFCNFPRLTVEIQTFQSFITEGNNKIRRITE